MVPTGQLSHADRESIVTALREYMEQHDLGQAQVAKAVGSSATYISDLLTGSSRLPLVTRDTLLRALNDWMERDHRARESHRDVTLVHTKVADRLIATSERLVERADMALAYGPAGIGKSVVLDAIVAEVPTAHRITIDSDTRTGARLRVALYNILHRRQRLTPPKLVELVARLRRPAGVATHSLLLVDEAHRLHESGLRLLVDLHDAAQCSVLLVGTVDLLGRVATDDDPEYGQLSSRVGMRIDLAPELLGRGMPGGRPAPLFTVAQVRAICQRGKLKFHPGAARMLTTVANTTRGTLRRARRLADWAEVGARHAGASEITVEHVQIAAQIVEPQLNAAAPLPPDHEDTATPEAITA